MFAKLYFAAGWGTNSVKQAIFNVACGVTSLTTLNANLTASPANTATVVTALSYIINNKTPSGWTNSTSLTANVSTTSIMYAPCANSTKNKYVALGGTNSYVSMSSVSGMTNSTYTSDPGTEIIQAGADDTSSTSRHNTAYPLEVWISCSNRHLLVACNRPGYNHGTSSGTGNQTSGYVAGVLEHVATDAWMVDGINHLPAIVLRPGQNWQSNNVNGPTTIALDGYATGWRDITQATVTDNYSSVSSTKAAYTRYGSGTIQSITNNGTCTISQDENTVVRTLMPFGVRNQAQLQRGGAVTDLSNVYLCPAIFAANTVIQVGTDTTNLFHIFKAFNGVDIAVPRG